MAAFLPQHKVHPLRGTVLGLVREDRLGSIDEEERSLAGRLSRGGVDGPQHGLEIIEAAPAACLELLLEGPRLEAPQDLCVGALSLAIALRVCHQSITYLRSKVSAICFENVASELRAIVGHDTIRDPETAHEVLDELDGRAGRDGADGFYLDPLGGLVEAT